MQVFTVIAYAEKDFLLIYMSNQSSCRSKFVELMFNEIFVMHMHNSQVVYNFYEQAMKLFL